MTLAALELHVAAAMAERLAALRGEGDAPLFADVLDALEADALTSWPKTPAAIVFPISEEAEESTTRRVEQAPVQHTVRIGVSIIARAPNDRSGKRGSERLSPLLAAARRALQGWQPPGQREVLSYTRGRLIGSDDGRVQWVDEFTIRRVATAGVIDVAPEGAQ